MNKTKSKRTSIVVMSIILTILFVMASPMTVFAEEEKCFIVSLHGQGPEHGNHSPSETMVVDLKPKVLSVPKGSCVVFINWVRTSQILINFEEGKRCDDATEAPIGFTLGGAGFVKDPKHGCYVTDYLKRGEISSLRFMEAGSYDYEIHVKNVIAPVARGKITAY